MQLAPVTLPPILRDISLHRALFHIKNIGHLGVAKLSPTAAPLLKKYYASHQKYIFSEAGGLGKGSKSSDILGKLRRLLRYQPGNGSVLHSLPGFLTWVIRYSETLAIAKCSYLHLYENENVRPLIISRS